MARKPFLSWALAVLAALVAAPVAAAVPASFAVNTVRQLDSPLIPGEYVWDDAGAPAGRLRIVVDLDAEILYAYRGGMEIGRSTILYGYDAKPTPTGIFPIIDKDADHWSSTYDAPMPWSLRLTRGGVAIHGSLVEEGYASHGCIGVPEDFAQALFKQARLGDLVLVTRGWMTDAYGTPVRY
jgi:hypothetical protein